jgi:hypothetical protein
VCNSTFHRELRRRQSLPKDLATENLGGANVTAVTTKDVVFDTLERKQLDQVF